MGKSAIITTEKGFYVGDPCYVFEGSWMEIVDSFYDDSNKDKLTAVLKGTKIGMSNTAYGDGMYAGSDGQDYPVDAGLIGITPLEIVEVKLEDDCHFGKIVPYKGRATVAYDEGTITIEFLDDENLEDIVINTAYDEDEEYDDEDEYDDFLARDNWL